MMFLAIRTDSPHAELYLIGADKQGIAQDTWEAGRQLAAGLLSHIETLLHSTGSTWQDLHGVIIFRGPGSFTGLRIGITVANTLAYAQSIPIVGVDGEGWQDTGYQRLRSGDNDNVVLPVYGADPHITKPKK